MRRFNKGPKRWRKPQFPTEDTFGPELAKHHKKMLAKKFPQSSKEMRDPADGTSGAAGRKNPPDGDCGPNS